MVRRVVVGRVRAGLLVVLVLAVWAAPAAADERVRIDDGAEPIDADRLAEVVDEAVADGVDLHVAVLADEPADDARSEARRMVERSGEVAMVITPDQVGGWSDVHRDEVVQQGVQQALAVIDDDVPGAVEAFATALDEGGTVGFFGRINTEWIIIAVIAAVGLLGGGGGGYYRRRRRHYGSYGYGHHHRRRRFGGFGGGSGGGGGLGSRSGGGGLGSR